MHLRPCCIGRAGQGGPGQPGLAPHQASGEQGHPVVPELRSPPTHMCTAHLTPSPSPWGRDP